MPAANRRLSRAAAVHSGEPRPTEMAVRALCFGIDHILPAPLTEKLITVQLHQACSD